MQSEESTSFKEVVVMAVDTQESLAVRTLNFCGVGLGYTDLTIELIAEG